MGQKSNPKALRLEKTNSHYAACWYSDLHYAKQLCNHYMIANYINKIFQKIKRCEPIIYFCGHQQGNSIVCIFPRKKRRFARSKEGKGLAVQWSKAVQGRSHSEQPVLTSRSDVSDVQSMLLLSAVYFSHMQCMRTLTSQHSINSELTADIKSSSSELTQERREHRNVTDTGTSQHATPITTPPNNTFVRPARAQSIISRETPFIHKNSITVNDCGSLESALLFLFCNGVQENVKNKGILSRNSSNPFAADKKLLVKNSSNCEDNTLYAIEKVLDSFATTECKKNIVLPIKVSAATQNAEFIAQKISWALEKRVHFNRFRRQILWECKRSRHLKGLRVSVCGRVENKSKKAQKARARTFQWGQTELHVFSSLVQFIQKDVLTPFGKIGIKVWVCYGI